MQYSDVRADNTPEVVMDERLSELRGRIARGEYQIDPVAVADAILDHLGQLSECSYPESGRSASVNETPGLPATTRPTHVSLTPLGQLSAAASTAVRALGGMQAQSS
jgi:hypothetical protein